MSGMDEILRIAQQAFPRSKVTALKGNSLEVLYDTEGYGFAYCTVANGRSLPEYYGIKEFRYLLTLAKVFSVSMISNKQKAMLRLQFEEIRVDRTNMTAEDFSYVPLTDEEKREIDNRENSKRPIADFEDGLVPEVRNVNLPGLRKAQDLLELVREFFKGIPCEIDGPGDSETNYDDGINVRIIAGYPAESWFTLEFGTEKRLVLLRILDLVDALTVGIESTSGGYDVCFDFVIYDVRFD